MRALPLFLLMFSAPALAQEVAAVLLFSGSVTIESGGVGHPARVGEGLTESAKVIVGEESSVILHLQNEYLVRLDDEMALPVSKLALLRAPAAQASVKDQLATLLDPAERADFPGVDRAERVAGWHARLSAGAAAPPGTASQARTAKSAPPAPKLEEMEEVSSGGFEVSPPPPSPATAPPAKKPKKPKKAEKMTDSVSPAPPPEVAAAEVLAAPTLSDAAPEALLSLLGSDAGRACVAEWTAALPLPLSAAEFDLRLEGGVVRRVYVGEGLQTPSCLETLWVGTPLEGAPTRLIFSAPLGQ